MLGECDVMTFLATKDAARATTFYANVLGLKLVNVEPWAVVIDAHGTMLRIQKVEAPVVAPYTVLGWKVSDIAATIRDLGARGVTFVRYPGMTQDDLGIWTTPDGSKVAWFKDPDGHTLSLTQFS